MRAHMGTVVHKINFIAFRFVYSPSRNLERINATTTIVAIFPSSEGWNWMPAISSHRRAELVVAPIKRTANNIPIAMGYSRIIRLNHRQGMLCIAQASATPAINNVKCVPMGRK